MFGLIGAKAPVLGFSALIVRAFGFGHDLGNQRGPRFRRVGVLTKAHILGF